MFRSKDDNFNCVKDFHAKMDEKTQEVVQPYSAEEAGHRAEFKIEELVEFLYSTAGNEAEFKELIVGLHQALDRAVDKVAQKGLSKDPLVGQVDALVDLLYLTYGTFVLMGVDPAPLFDIVHQSNMGKIFPDGKAHFDPRTHKILKPDNWEADYAPEPALKREMARQLER